MANWLRWKTNFFDPAGKAAITNGVAPGETRRFLRLSVD